MKPKEILLKDKISYKATAEETVLEIDFIFPILTIRMVTK